MTPVLGLVVLLLAALALCAYMLLPLFIKNIAQPQTNDAKRELEEERNAALGSIRALEKEFQDQKVTEKDFERLRRNDQKRAALAIEQLSKLNNDTQQITQGTLSIWPLAIMASLGLGFGIFAAPQLQQLGLKPAERQEFSDAAKLETFENKHGALTKATDQEITDYAEISWKLKDYQRVLIANGALLKRNPRNSLALRRYGMALFFSGETDQAEQLLRLSVQLEPNTEAYMTLGNLLFSSRNDPAGALAAWQQYQKLGGNSPRIKDLINAATQRLGSLDPGIKSFATNCAGCHGSNGQGIVGPQLSNNTNAANNAFVIERLKTGKGSMPAFKQITGQELAALVKYVNGLGKQK